MALWVRRRIASMRAVISPKVSAPSRSPKHSQASHTGRRSQRAKKP